VGIEFRCNHQLRYIGLAKMQMAMEMNRFLTKHNFQKISLAISRPVMTYALFILSKIGQAF
jgi:DNA polymerase-3 subunit alpha/error-prone DNA polymerase